ncbi:hypothetical protein CMO91_00975 [Candidatus Woesearchaeota archaeon]|nr:hypothetical protein [Candidatus Woesearchaeota archaeon]|tara:strand:+ start:671 stop:1027 length:357 start_codon:yes stop_codon:yes gene_type:complete
MPKNALSLEELPVFDEHPCSEPFDGPDQAPQVYEIAWITFTKAEEAEFEQSQVVHVVGRSPAGDIYEAASCSRKGRGVIRVGSDSAENHGTIPPEMISKYVVIVYHDELKNPMGQKRV